MATVSTEHIWLDERGVAWIDATNTKVIEVALDKVAGGLSPEEIVQQHYGQFSLAQIHAALAYYYDHQAAFDAESARQVREVEALRAQTLDSPGRKRLQREAENSCGAAADSPHPDVDVSQIDDLLSLTPTERLLRHEQALILMDELRKAGRKLYGFDPRAVVEAHQQSS